MCVGECARFYVSVRDAPVRGASVEPWVTMGTAPIKVLHYNYNYNYVSTVNFYIPVAWRLIA